MKYYLWIANVSIIQLNPLFYKYKVEVQKFFSYFLTFNLKHLSMILELNSRESGNWTQLNFPVSPACVIPLSSELESKSSLRFYTPLGMQWNNKRWHKSASHGPSRECHVLWVLYNIYKQLSGVGLEKKELHFKFKSQIKSKENSCVKLKSLRIHLLFFYKKLLQR